MKIQSMKINHIKEGDNSVTEIFGYRTNYLKIFVTSIFYILTGFILRLIFHWMPKWQIYATHSVCSLEEADVIIAKDQYQRYWIQKIKFASTESEKCRKSDLKNEKSEIIINHLPGHALPYFNHKKLKYVWNPLTLNFETLDGVEQKCSEFFKSKPLTNDEAVKQIKLFGKNAIEVQLTPLLKLFIKESLNPFYVFQICSVVLWFLDGYVVYAGCIIFMSTMSLSVQLYNTRKNEKSLRNTIASNGYTNTYRDLALIQIDTTELVPGDIVELPRSGGLMHCDAVLISGNCIVNESMLTGESVPITKTPLPNPMGLIPFSPNQMSTNELDIKYCKTANNDEPFDLKKHGRHVLFCGTSVIQTRNFENEPVLAVVVRTGFLTAKGELVRSILFPKPIDAKLNKDGFKFIGVLSLFALVGFVYTVIVMVARKIAIISIVIRSLDIITIIIPPALPVAMTIGVIFAQSRLKKKSIFCISPNTINACGGINVSCFDKTGTLTEDGLDLWGVVASKSDGSFGDPITNPETLPLANFVECMATCHSLNIINGEISGDPLDVKMFESIQWNIKEGVDGNENDFEMSVPIIAYKDNYEAKPHQIAILRQFPFSSSLQRMSVITKFRTRMNFNIYVKGSPEVISTLCRKETLPRDFSSKLLHFTHSGYRVIALAHRPLKISYSKLMKIPRQQVESDLRFLGFLVMENRLKPETEAIINQLKSAMIRPIMVTGDNMLTAISVARDCEMIAENDKVILVDARMSPDNSTDPIIEFHYAEDLQRQVNEIAVFKNENHKTVKICIMERPDFHLAMSGKTWELIRDKCPQLIPKLVVKGTVFARFAPDQKSQLIEALQSVGYYVSMCGDGANDCGALKAAHAGISLSETEASVASPFTSKIPNISCVPELIKQGRCALTTSFGTFKFMAGYSFTQFISVLMLYWISSNISDFQFLYIDLVIITTLSITFGYSKACKKLSVETPSMRLLTIPMMTSLVFQCTINALFQVAGYFYVKYQSWYVLPVSKDEVIHQSHANMAVFSVAIFQYIILALVFSKGAPFRAPIYRNYIFIANITGTLALTVYVIFKPFQWLKNLLELESFPSLNVSLILLGFSLANFGISYLVEFVIDNITLQQQMKRIRLLLFPISVDQKEYEKIREDINNNASSWPPIIKCVSVQEMRSEIFTDSSNLHHSQSAQDINTTKDKESDMDILREESESDQENR